MAILNSIATFQITLILSAVLCHHFTIRDPVGLADAEAPIGWMKHMARVAAGKRKNASVDDSTSSSRKTSDVSCSFRIVNFVLDQSIYFFG